MNIKESQTTASKNKEIIRHVFTEINNGNLEPFMSIVDENFKLTLTGSLPISGTIIGLQEVIKILSVITNAFQVQPKVIIDEIESFLSENVNFAPVTVCTRRKLEKIRSSKLPYGSPKK